MGEWNGDKPIASIVQKIAKECEKAGASAWTVTKIIKELSQEEKEGSAKLRKKALEMLANLDPQAAQVYMSFQQMSVRTSVQKIGHFDRGNIIRSLLKETDVTRGVAEKIGHEVEEKIKDLEIKYISTALIREMVNVKLLEYGHENIRDQYTRVGLPTYDLNQKIRIGPYTNNAMLSEFNLLKIIPRELGEMHLRSDLFIAELGDFSTKPVAICHKFEAEESVNKTIFSNLKKMRELSQFVSWPINAMEINAAIAMGSNKRNIGKNIELFVDAFVAMFSKSMVPRNIGIGLFAPENMSGVDRDLLSKSANLFMKEEEQIAKINTRAIICIDNKYKLKLLTHKQGTILNCGNKALMPLNDLASEKNLCGLFGINLAKHATHGLENKFLEHVVKCCEAIKELAARKRNILSKRDYLEKQGLNVNEMSDAAAVYGIESAAQTIMGREGKAWVKLAEKALTTITKELGKGFIIAKLINKDGISRFETENRQQSKSSEDISVGKIQEIRVAKNKSELNTLIEEGVEIIEFG